ncbi:MAG: hypothetical protein AAFN40_25045 [Cyanobacteria bacterium J06560_6]
MTTQNDILEQARRGSASAIAALMNQILEKRHVAISVQRCDRNYHLSVVAEQLPQQKEIVDWITQGFAKLNIPNVQRILISGRLQHASEVSWQQSICIDRLLQNQRASQALHPLSELRQYCFISNRSLLSYNLDFPPEIVARIVLSFVALPESQQLAIAPHLKSVLEEKKDSTNIKRIDKEGRIFVQSALNLSGNNLRLAAVWLSRYCAQPDVTAKQMIKVIAAFPEASAAISVQRDETLSVLPTNAASQAFSPQASSPKVTFTALKPKVHKKRFRTESPWARWLFPFAWSLCLFLSIALAVDTAEHSLGENHLKNQQHCYSDSTSTRCFRKKPEHSFSSIQMASAVIRHEFPIFDAINTFPTNAAEPAFPLKKALGVYDIFISLGASTLFTAVGLWVAMVISPCYTWYSLNGLYRTASILGLIEAIAHKIPIFGFIAGFAIHLGAIGLANLWVKDFRLEWTRGFKALMQGAFIIFSVKIVLILLLYGAITSFLV